MTSSAGLPVSLGPDRCDFVPWKAAMGKVLDRFAFDCETTALDMDRPDQIPVYVLGAACDGRRGYFVRPEEVQAFFLAHRECEMIFHNAAFDLKVLQVKLAGQMDLYQAVERRQIWDTMILHQLLTLAREGHTVQGRRSLDHCAEEYLKCRLSKDLRDDKGAEIRTNFGRFLGKSPLEIPQAYLEYLARDTLATWLIEERIQKQISEILHRSRQVWGYVDEPWLEQARVQYGPLTHHLQLRASILMDVISSTGIALDAHRAEQKIQALKHLRDECKKQMHREGYLPGETGSDKALQSILSRKLRQQADLDYPRTPTGKYSTRAEDLETLKSLGPFFDALIQYRQCEKLLSTYLAKMTRPRLFARFGALLKTGRSYCGGGFNLQNLPREKGEQQAAATIRGVFVPDEGEVFIDVDYSQIELVVLAGMFKNQFCLGDQLAGRINNGEDIHRLIAAAVTGKPVEQISKEERNSAKAVSFGRPGGMGAARLQGIANATYRQELSLVEIEKRIQAYHQLCPELDRFLEDEIKLGPALVRLTGLDIAEYSRDCNLNFLHPTLDQSSDWLGWMMLKVLGEPVPITQGGKPYSERQIQYFWKKAQLLIPKLGPKAAQDLRLRKPGPGLAGAVRDLAGRRAVFTLTGRLRAAATFCSARNTIFQGVAADGAILGLWKVWRAGYKVVNFVHDQVVVAYPAGSNVPSAVKQIEQLLIEGMQQVVPNMQVRVESVVTRSFHKDETDPRYRQGQWMDEPAPQDDDIKQG